MRDEILEWLDRDPFVPFRITLMSGQEYEVHYPDLVTVGRDLIWLAHPKSDRESVLRLLTVASLDIIL
jgi:hypothetical protein